MARAGIVGLLFAAGGFKPMQFIAVGDIGIFASKALLHPDASEFGNATLDLSSGIYTLKDVRAAIATAQGGKQPWIMRFPTVTRRLLPYDFRQLMYCGCHALMLAIAAEKGPRSLREARISARGR